MGAETKTKPTIPPEDLKLLRDTFNVTSPTVIKLLAGGVDEEDLQDVLDGRSKLSVRKKNGAVRDQVTVDAVLYAYNACDGDIEEFQAIIEYAEELLQSTHFSQSSIRTLTENFNKALYDAVADWQAGTMDD